MDFICDIKLECWLTWVSNWANCGSDEVREEAVVREETVTWRMFSWFCRSFCLISDVALSIFSLAIVEWREAVSSSDTVGVAVGVWGILD